jgi:dihydrofolate reductase
VGEIILQMMITADGFVAGPNDEMDWIDNDPVMGKAHYKLAEEADAAVIGHHVYEGMAQFWPQVAADPEASNNEAEFGKLMNRMRKVVVSTRPEELSWENCDQLLGNDEEDIIAKLRELKRTTDGYLLLYGGVQTAETVVRHGLVDEYRLDLCPTVLGAGKAIFSGRARLRLVDVTPYESGAMTVTYTAAP